MNVAKKLKNKEQRKNNADCRSINNNWKIEVSSSFKTANRVWFLFFCTA